MSTIFASSRHVTFESEVEAPVPPEKRHGANQFQSGRWIHAAQPLSARQKVNDTEDHHLDDDDAGGGEFRRSMQPARTGPVTGAAAGSLSRPLDGALFLNHLKVAAASLSAHVKFSPTQKLNESCRHCELNRLKSKRKPSHCGMIDTVGLDCCCTDHRN